MSSFFRREYLEAIFLRHKRAPRSDKSTILNEFCAPCGHHRKHAVRLLREFKRFIRSKRKKKGRATRYRTEDILRPLKGIWLAANLPCSKRLKAALPLWLPGYVQRYGAPSEKTEEGPLGDVPCKHGQAA